MQIRRLEAEYLGTPPGLEVVGVRVITGNPAPVIVCSPFNIIIFFFMSIQKQLDYMGLNIMFLPVIWRSSPSILMK